MNSQKPSAHLSKPLLALLIAFAFHLIGIRPIWAEPSDLSLRVDFSGYSGGSVEDWMKSKNYQFESDAKKPDRLGLSIKDGVLSLEAKRSMSGLILNDNVNIEPVRTVRITWGVSSYPKDASYAAHVNNEPLMLYFFFGKDKLPSGHVLIPNSPYFIGLFLCQDEELQHPYKGRYFHAGGRFVCLGKPAPGQMVTSEFDLDAAFKRYFQKDHTPSLTGISFGIDTSKSGDSGRAGAFIKSIDFLGGK